MLKGGKMLGWEVGVYQRGSIRNTLYVVFRGSVYHKDSYIDTKRAELVQHSAYRGSSHRYNVASSV